MTPALTPALQADATTAGEVACALCGQPVPVSQSKYMAKKRDFQSGNYSITEEVDVLQQEAYQLMAYVILYTNIEAIYGSDVGGVTRPLTEFRNRQQLTTMSQQHMSITLLITGLNILTMRSTSKAGAKIDTIQFTDPESSAKVIIANTNIISTGINLNTACCIGITTTLCHNAKALLKVHGRLHRLGQSKQVRRFIMVVKDSSHDRQGAYQIGSTAFSGMQLARLDCRVDEYLQIDMERCLICSPTLQIT
ncbi:hypothetical protein TRIATDRAFT_89763 [Trichoderma atroviride IMI 206040]|uniref:Helicase C-terminal domain-containing protein n=1 Tax=Hypocrea atroviridis (strain ATCC 20476 / IMI 206040) TaxID=452589 RepID=G9NSH9_HYPAI|nr:uncharacterized protein TRIATDRAFT_89763 [Trichoderma atroviride IMI 206040]EHK46378.1 hypothetical protein TRIATDRAFT_89763 [Trichoderma atroviride IMI 206040]